MEVEKEAKHPVSPDFLLDFPEAVEEVVEVVVTRAMDSNSPGFPPGYPQAAAEVVKAAMDPDFPVSLPGFPEPRLGFRLGSHPMGNFLPRWLAAAVVHHQSERR
jgi:hypothetical protein